MPRRIALLSILGLLAVALGCKHIGGKCDCGAHPGDAVIAGPTNPNVAAPVVPHSPPAIPTANGVKVPDRLPQ